MTDEKDELEVFFEGEEHDEISTEVEKVEEVTKVEAETETVVEEAETETETETTSEKEQKSVPLAALLDERRKAQSLKEENEALRGKIPKSEEAPDPYEDIDAYDTFKRNQWQNEQNAIVAQKRKENLDVSRSKMLEQHNDYDEMERIFEIMTTHDRSLIDKMFASGNEAKFAYDTAKTYKDSLMPQHETKETSKTTETSITEMPNLATATAQASNTTQLEKEADIDDVFADMKY